MPLYQVVFILVCIGVAMYFLFKYVPMAAPFPTIIKVVVVVGVILWLLSLYGLVPNFGSVRIGK